MQSEIDDELLYRARGRPRLVSVAGLTADSAGKAAIIPERDNAQSAVQVPSVRPSVRAFSAARNKGKFVSRYAADQNKVPSECRGGVIFHETGSAGEHARHDKSRATFARRLAIVRSERSRCNSDEVETWIWNTNHASMKRALHEDHVDSFCDLAARSSSPRLTFFIPRGCETRRFFLSRDCKRPRCNCSLRSSSDSPSRDKNADTAEGMWGGGGGCARYSVYLSRPTIEFSRGARSARLLSSCRKKCSASNQSMIVGTWRP